MAARLETSVKLKLLASQKIVKQIPFSKTFDRGSHKRLNRNRIKYVSTHIVLPGSDFFLQVG